MTVLRVTIRRPPCKQCGGSGFSSEIGLLGTPQRCRSCLGLAAQVEYFFEYGPSTHTKAYWEVWDDEALSGLSPGDYRILVGRPGARSPRRPSLHAP